MKLFLCYKLFLKGLLVKMSTIFLCYNVKWNKHRLEILFAFLFSTVCSKIEHSSRDCNVVVRFMENPPVVELHLYCRLLIQGLEYFNTFCALFSRSKKIDKPQNRLERKYFFFLCLCCVALLSHLQQMTSERSTFQEKSVFVFIANEFSAEASYCPSSILSIFLVDKLISERSFISFEKLFDYLLP